MLAQGIQEKHGLCWSTTLEFWGLLAITSVGAWQLPVSDRDLLYKPEQTSKHTDRDFKRYRRDVDVAGGGGRQRYTCSISKQHLTYIKWQADPTHSIIECCCLIVSCCSSSHRSEHCTTAGLHADISLLWQLDSYVKLIIPWCRLKIWHKRPRVLFKHWRTLNPFTHLQTFNTPEKTVIGNTIHYYTNTFCFCHSHVQTIKQTNSYLLSISLKNETSYTPYIRLIPLKWIRSNHIIGTPSILSNIWHLYREHIQLGQTETFCN